MTRPWVNYLALVLIGAAWGLTFPLSKVAVSTGYQPFGILVWQLIGAIVLTGAVALMRARALVLSRRFAGLFLGVALLGTVVSGYLSYTAAAQLPAGVLAIIIALVPLFAMPMALVMGFERPSARRLFGLVLGAASVAVLVGPETSLPDPGKAIFVLVAMGATLAYAAEGNFLAWYGATDLDPVQILFGASVVALVLVVPPTLASGQFISPLRPWGAPELAIVAISALSTIAYVGYIWLIANSGPVFAVQVSYLVTAFGVFWAMIFLGESYSAFIWLALLLMLGGVYLVQPRR
jgi:drug/metabolite transporter (DMT)-like permease